MRSWTEWRGRAAILLAPCQDEQLLDDCADLAVAEQQLGLARDLDRYVERCWARWADPLVTPLYRRARIDDALEHAREIGHG